VQAAAQKQQLQEPRQLLLQELLLLPKKARVKKPA
jgi:hypothetical protein